jgi:hypothetical protein
MTMHNINLKKRFAVKVSAVVAAMLMMTSMAFAQNRFGAIYFSQSTGAHGYSYDYNSQYQAEQGALNECLSAGGTDCQRATWFRNACGALAVGDGNGWGARWGNNRNGAEQNALQSCNRNAGNCRILRWVCTSR